MAGRRTARGERAGRGAGGRRKGLSRAARERAALAAIVEASQDAIVGWRLEDGRIESWNPAAERLYGYAAEEAVGRSIFMLIPQDLQARAREVIAELRQGRAFAQYDTRRVRKDGREVEVSLTVSPLRDSAGRIVGASTIGRDVTEQRRAERALEESEARLRFTLEASRVGAWDWDVRTGAVAWSPNLEDIHRRPRGSFGRSFEAVLAEVHPEDRPRVEAAVRRALEGGDEYEVEYRLAHADVWVQGKGRVVRDASGAPTRMAGICWDVTERKRMEERQRLLLAELNHRVKNTLGVVSAIAQQTLQRHESPEEFRAAFTQRLAAMARRHDLLMQSNWEGAPLSRLVEQELAPHRGLARAELALEGDDVLLTPPAALSLGLALHELATNASKYGALSTPAGAVTVQSRLEAEGGDARLRILWRERGGPRIAGPPSRRGFGSTLLERGLAYELGGEVKLLYPADGLRCEVTLPFDARIGRLLPQPAR
jgi:PAS domain S-box-containing protein